MNELLLGALFSLLAMIVFLLVLFYVIKGAVREAILSTRPKVSAAPATHADQDGL